MCIRAYEHTRAHIIMDGYVQASFKICLHASFNFVIDKNWFNYSRLNDTHMNTKINDVPHGVYVTGTVRLICLQIHGARCVVVFGMKLYLRK